MKTKATTMANAANAGKVRRSSPLAAWVYGAVFGSALLADQATATPGAGVVAEPVSLGSLPEPVRTKLKTDEFAGFGDGTAVAQIVVMKFTIEPGGFFGWHRHGGPVWVVVAAGTLTLYDSDDVTCTGRQHAPGGAFLDPGDHVHNARNEGVNPVVVYGTFMLPAGGAIRVDAANPNVCLF
jgi:quercetin dioxygenase-like cupin family protein